MFLVTAAERMLHKKVDAITDPAVDERRLHPAKMILAATQSEGVLVVSCVFCLR